MSANDRERILSAVELALGFPPREDDLFALKHPGASPDWVPPEESWEPVQKEIQGLSARFHQAKDVQEAQGIIRSILAEHAVRKAVHWEHPLLNALGIEALLREAGVEVISPVEGEYFARQSAQADLGITAADCMLVESGALMVSAKKGEDRSTSLLPPVHLAVVCSGQRLPAVEDLVPLWREWIRAQGRLPSAIHLITGPSRTADIELTIVLGAHGPKALHVLALDPGCIPEER